MRILMILLAAVLLAPQFVNADYQPPASLTHPKHTVRIGGEKYSASQDDDSGTFQQAIDDVSAAGGGIIKVPAGDYRLIGIMFKSDVHLIFESGVTVRPRKGGTGNLFNLGGQGHVKNVSMVGPEDRVLIDFGQEEMGTSLRVVGVSDCMNFHVGNFNVEDNRTTFSSVILGWGGESEQAGKALCGRDGLVDNITAKNAHYGYGAIQAHSGENIVFRNIKAVGGVAVRLETGLIPMNKAHVGGLFNILVEDVTSVNGQGALMLQPHTMNHGDVVGRNITADGSEFAVYVAKPFVSKTRYPKSDMTPGSFKSITVDGVKATYRDGPIVTRFVHLKYYPQELHSQITYANNGPEPSMRGPSIAAVAVMQGDASNFTLSNVQAIGFEHHPDIIYPKDLFKGKVTPSGEKPTKQAKAESPKNNKVANKAATKSERQSAAATDTQTIHVVLLAGQSNMAGKGILSELSQADQERVKAVSARVMIIKNGKPAKPLGTLPAGFNKDKQPDHAAAGRPAKQQDTQAAEEKKGRSENARKGYKAAKREFNAAIHKDRFGPEIFCGVTLAESNPDQQYLFIKHAVGGTSLYGAWNPQWSAKQSAEVEKGTRKQQVKLYEDHVAAIKKNLDKLDKQNKSYKIIGVAWMQGESDAAKEVAARSYEANLAKLIAAYRTEFKLPKMPFVCGQINSHYGKFKEGPEMVRAAFVTVAEADAKVVVIRTMSNREPTDYPKVDGAHYNSEGQKRLGTAMAKALAEMN